MGRRMCPIDGDYERTTEISDPEVLTDAEQSLLIDQSKHFNFYVDSVDLAAANVPVLFHARCGKIR